MNNGPTEGSTKNNKNQKKKKTPAKPICEEAHTENARKKHEKRSEEKNGEKWNETKRNQSTNIEKQNNESFKSKLKSHLKCISCVFFTRFVYLSSFKYAPLLAFVCFALF